MLAVGPIKLLCESDIRITREIMATKKAANRGSMQETRLCRTEIRYEKAVRSFGNDWDVLRACQSCMDCLNASKIAPESFCR